MPRIVIDLKERDYLNALRAKGNQTHAQIYFQGLDVEYEPPKIGRPRLDEMQAYIRDYEEKMRQELLERRRKEHDKQIKADLKKYGPKADEARKALGIDSEKSGFWNKDKLKKRP